MNKKKNIGMWILLYLIFFCSGVWLCKEVTIKSYLDIYLFDLNNITGIGYQRVDNCYVPVEEDRYISVHVGNEPFNNVMIELEQPLTEGTTIDVSFIDGSETNHFLQTLRVKSGTKTINIKLETIQAKEVDFRFSTSCELYIKNISIRNQVYNFIQKNLIWSMTLVAVALVSSILVVVIYFGKSKEKKVQKSVKRDSNIELLRVIAMILLIGHHLVVHGGILGTGYMTNKLISVFFVPWGKICFDAFVAISTWYLVDKTFDGQRFIKTWLQVFTYSVVFTVISSLLGKEITIYQFLSSFLPIAGNSHGFASAYLAFYLVVPFIAKATKNLEKRQARFLLLIVFYFQVGSQIIGTITGYKQYLASAVTLFVLCYIISLNLKKWPIKILDNVKFDLAIVFSIICFGMQQTFQTYGGLWPANSGVVNLISSTCLTDESGLFFIIGGYALFFAFKNIKIKYSPLINTISGCTFGVLLIHDHNFFRSVLWNKVVATHVWYNSPHYLLQLMINILIIFTVCIVIEYNRQCLIERKIMNLSFVKKAGSKLNVLVNRE